MRRLVSALRQLASAPGVIAHEGAHALACLLTGTRIREICWFRFGDPVGYVVHDRAASATAGVLIGFAPVIVNAGLGAAAAYGPSTRLLTGVGWGPLDFVLAWLGLSIAMRAFPSRADAHAMWQAAGSARFGVLKRAAVAPLWLTVQLLSLGSRVWLDLVFGVAVCLAVPLYQQIAAGRIASPF